MTHYEYMIIPKKEWDSTQTELAKLKDEVRGLRALTAYHDSPCVYCGAEPRRTFHMTHHVTVRDGISIEQLKEVIEEVISDALRRSPPL